MLAPPPKPHEPAVRGDLSYAPAQVLVIQPPLPRGDWCARRQGGPELACLRPLPLMME